MAKTVVIPTIISNRPVPKFSIIYLIKSTVYLRFNNVSAYFKQCKYIKIFYLTADICDIL